MSRYARFAPMRRLLAAASATVVVVAFTPTPAPAVQALAPSMAIESLTTVSPTLGAQQHIHVTDIATPIIVDTPGGIFVDATRLDAGGAPVPCSPPPVRCTGVGDITLNQKNTSPPLSLHGVQFLVHAYVEADDTVDAFGALKIRFQSDLSITAASLDSGTKQFTTSWTAGGPDPALRIANSEKVAGAIVQVTGLPAGWTGPAECTNPGGGTAVCAETSPNSLTFNLNVTACGTYGPFAASVSSGTGGSFDPSSGNNSGTAGPLVIPCPTTNRPTTPRTGGGGGARPTTPPPPAVTTAPTTVDTTPTPRITVVAGDVTTGAVDAAPNSNATTAIVVALTSLVLALGLVGGWWIYQRRRRAASQDPW
jgi:hypothetical protein